MTPIEKAIKALEDEGLFIAADIVRRVSTIKLEAGDVAKFRDLLGGQISPLAVRHEDYRPAFLRLIAFLGHGEEG
jgi:hypothetical protein